MVTLCRNDTMTPRERVLRTFALEEADRVPVNYSANPGIHGRLAAHFGLEPAQYEELLRALGVDFRAVNPAYTGPRLHPEVDGRHVDPVWGIRTRYIDHGSGGYWDFCDFPLREATEDEVAAWPMPSPDDYDFGVLTEACERHAGHAKVTHMGFGDIINGNGMLRSMEQTLVDLLTDDPAGLLLAKRRLDIQLELCRRTLEAAKGAVDIVQIGEDLGTQIAPIIDYRTFQRNILPYYQRVTALAHDYGAKAMIHTCGSSSWAYEDFIAAGVDAVDTLQPEAVDMSPRYLKDTFGGRVAFHGCISTAEPVTSGTPEDVVANCQMVLDIMMPGGGYCFAPTHALQDNTPTENVVAMYKTAHAYGRYARA